MPRLTWPRSLARSSSPALGLVPAQAVTVALADGTTGKLAPISSINFGSLVAANVFGQGGAATRALTNDSPVAITETMGSADAGLAARRHWLRRNATHVVPSRPARRRQECRNSTRAARLRPTSLANVVASSPSVVADLTDEHYLDATDLESLLRSEQQTDVDEDFVVAAPPDGVAQPVEPEPVIGPTGRPWPDLPTPPPLTEHGPALIIAMCNQKGGVGKTTTTINLGAALAELGRHVLLVDFDPQGSLSVGLGVNPHTLSASIYNLLMSRDTSIDDVIDQTNVPGLDILPSNIDLSAAEIQLVSEVAREQTLVRLLESVRSRYDVILIDCAPSLGLLTINALTAADRVIMPLECEFFALRGIALLTDTIAKVQDRLNPQSGDLGNPGHDVRPAYAAQS